MFPVLVQSVHSKMPGMQQLIGQWFLTWSAGTHKMCEIQLLGCEEGPEKILFSFYPHHSVFHSFLCFKLSAI